MYCVMLYGLFLLCVSFSFVLNVFVCFVCDVLCGLVWFVFVCECCMLCLYVFVCVLVL